MTTTRKRLTREEGRAQTRADLLISARQHFARHGYEGSSVEQIAEDAGYSRGAMHYNFKDKNDLFVAVLRDCFYEDVQNLEALMEAYPGDPTRVATAIFQASASDPSAYMLRLEFWMRALRDEGFRQVYLAEHRRFRDTLIRHGQAQLGAEASEFAALTMGLHNGLELVHLLDPAAVTPDTYRGIFERMLATYRIEQ